MANQYVNKVIVNNEIKMDLTEDTVTPKTLRAGFTAHDASGAPIVGNETLTDISEDGTDAGPILELNAEGWAEQEQYLGVNLLPFPYTGEDTTEYGITVTVNDDQSVTFSGPFTGSTTDSLKWSWYGEAGATNNLITPSGSTAIKYITVANKTVNRMVVMKFYDSSGNEIVTYSGLQNDTSYSIPSNASGMYIYEMITKLSNTGLLPFTASIMLTAGTTTYPYEPYVGGVPSPSPELPQEIKVARGRNLLNLSSKSSSGSGYPLGNSRFPISLSAGTYAFSFNSVSASGQWVCAFYDASNTKIVGPSARAVVSGTNTVVLTANADISSFEWYINTTYDIDSVQLELGSVATPYVPYGCVGVEAQGKNLLPNTQSQSYTMNGVTWTKNADGSITANGTASGSSYGGKSVCYINGNSLKPIAEGAYMLSDGGVGSENAWVELILSRNGTNLYRSTKNGATTVSVLSDTTMAVYISVASGYTANNLTFYPQLELGSEATEYEPYYHKTVPIPLPSKGFVASLPDGTHDILHLDGAGGYTWVENTEEITFDGSSDEEWQYYNSNGVNMLYTNVVDGPDYSKKTVGDIAYCDRYKNVAYSTVATSNVGMFAIGYISSDLTTSSRRILFISELTNKADWESELSTHPVTILYPLATPQTEQGYVEVWDNDFPLGCTIDIPELRNLNVEYFLYDSITRLADDYYDRTTNDISEAMSQTSDSATHEALAAIAPIEGDISSANYLVGAYLIHDNQLCEVTTPIATGEAITVGTNVVISSVATELGELQVAVQDIIDDPYILPTMSASEKGGAKVGTGLTIEDDILSVDMSSGDATDAGPLISLQAEGWAEQTQLTGKNLLDIATKYNSTDFFLSNGMLTNTSTDSRTLLTPQIQFFNGNTSILTREFVGDVIGTVTVNIPENATSVRLKHNGESLDLKIADVALSDIGVKTGDTITASFKVIANNPSIAGGMVISDIQLELGSTATSYEPYCGGVPSPNPDYPQDIRVVKGRNLSPVSSVTSNAYGGVEAATTIRLGSVVAGKTYTLSFKVPVNPLIENTSISFYVNVSDTEYSQGYVVLTYAKSVSLTFTATVSGSLRPYTGSGRFSANTEFMSDIQLEEGSVATSYVPYGYLGCEVQGRNLLDCISISRDANNLNRSYDAKTQMLVVSGTASASNTDLDVVFVHPLSIRSGTEMTLSCDNGSAKATSVFFHSSETQYTVYTSLSGGKCTVIAPSDMTIDFLRFRWQPHNGAMNFSGHLQLELGSVAHEYEPYIHKTIPIPLPSKGFVAALPDGTSDILRLDGAGKWEWESNVKNLVFDGVNVKSDGGVTNSAGVTRYYHVLSAADSAIPASSNNPLPDIYASHFMRKSANYTWGNTDSCVSINNATQIVFLHDSLNGVAFNTWLQSNPVTVLYPVASPTTEQGYLDNWDNNIPLHATIDIPELRNIGVECYMDEQASTLNVQWSERLRSEMDSTSTNAVTESLASLAPVENDISSANYPTGSYLIHNNQLYKVTNPIAIGETISTSTNVTAVTLSDDVKYLNDHPYILPTMSEDTKGGAKVGHGLYVENDILNIGGVDDPTDAGPIVELSAKGWAEQLTTTGKNLLDAQTFFADLASGYKTKNLQLTPNTTYVMSTNLPLNNNNGANLFVFATGDSGSTGTNGVWDSQSRTVTAGSDGIVIVGYRTLDYTDTSAAWYLSHEIQLELGSTATPYEPYTGGAPSPSPSYPQDIRVCRGRNLFDASTAIIGKAWNQNNSSARAIVNVEVEPSTAYTISNISGGFNPLYIYEKASASDTTYIANYDVNARVSRTITTSANTRCICVQFNKDAIMLSDITAEQVQLERGSQATPYVPYGYIGVDVQGRNLAANDLGIITTNGITFVPQDDGGIKITGTASANAFYWLRNTSAGIPLDAGTYVASSDIESTSNIIAQVGYVTQSGGELVYLWSSTTNYSSFEVPSGTYGVGWRVYVKSGATVNATVHLQIERGQKTTYVPYIKPYSIPIPLPERGYIAALPDGTSDILTIDGAGGYTWELNTDEVIFDGSSDEKWLLRFNNKNCYTISLRPTIARPSTNTAAANVLCDSFSRTNLSALETNVGIAMSIDGDIHISDKTDGDMTLADFTSWLSTHNVTVLYALTTPTTESGYIESMPTVPDHTTLTCPEMRDLVIRCCADAGAAEISQAWAKRFKMELDELREIVNGLASNS